MKSKTVIFIAILCTSIVAMLVTIPLRAIGACGQCMSGVQIATCLSFVLYFLLTVFVFKRFGGKLSTSAILSALIVGALIIELPIRFIDFSDTLITLPDAIIRVLAILGATIFVRSASKGTKTAVAVVSIAIVLLYVFILFNRIW